MVDLILHYRYGNEMRQASIGNISRREAEGLINELGSLRSGDGIVTISGPQGVQGMVPARNIDLAEVKDR